MPGTDITAVHGDMEDGDGVDTTDHTDTDTGAVRRGPLRMEKVNQDQTLTLMLMLMPGTDITAVHGDMEDGDGVDTTDHTDTDTGAVRKGPLRMEKLNQDQMLTLTLMPGTDITAVHGDTDTGAVRRGRPRMEMINLDPTPMLMLMLITVTGGLGGVAGAMEDGVDTTGHGDTGEGSKRYSYLVGTRTWESLTEDLALSTVNV